MGSEMWIRDGEKEACMNTRLEGGPSLRGRVKRSEPDKPLITIITATYNAAKYLPAAIQSIREQTYGNIEYIVVDGASTDGTAVAYTQLTLPTHRQL